MMYAEMCHRRQSRITQNTNVSLDDVLVLRRLPLQSGEGVEVLEQVVHARLNGLDSAPISIMCLFWSAQQTATETSRASVNLMGQTVKLRKAR